MCSWLGETPAVTFLTYVLSRQDLFLTFWSMILEVMIPGKFLYVCCENYSLYAYNRKYLLESIYCRNIDYNKYTSPTVIKFNV